MIARTDGHFFICSFCSVFRTLLYHVSHKIPAVVSSCAKAAACNVYCLHGKISRIAFTASPPLCAAKETGHVREIIVARSVAATVVVSDSLS
jgi:hypothetical protein